MVVGAEVGCLDAVGISLGGSDRPGEGSEEGWWYVGTGSDGSVDEIADSTPVGSSD